jgi:hypothetical protein
MSFYFPKKRKLLFYSFSQNEIITAGGFLTISVEKYNIITGDYVDPRATSNTVQQTAHLIKNCTHSSMLHYFAKKKKRSNSYRFTARH